MTAPIRKSSLLPGVLLFSAFAALPASAEILLDFTVSPGTTIGEDLVANYNQTTQTSTATFNDGVNMFNVTAAITGSATGPEATVPSSHPTLKHVGSSFGIDTALGNSQDNSNGLDETADSVTPETLTLTFSTNLILNTVNLSGFGSHSFNAQTIFEILGVTGGGQDYAIASNDPSVNSGQTVAGNTGVSVVTLPTPISLNAGESLLIRVVTDGDGDFDGIERSDFGLHSLDVSIPEPGSISLLLAGGALMLVRRR